MQIQKVNSTQPSQNFEGRLVIKMCNKGCQEVKTVIKTTKQQDRLIVETAGTMTEGKQIDLLTKKASQKFAALIEDITGKPLIKTRRKRLISLIPGVSVSYGDKSLKKGGAIVSLDLKS